MCGGVVIGDKVGLLLHVELGDAAEFFGVGIAVAALSEVAAAKGGD
ncbi:hypothetical protein l11_18970 [Neisseria weaveri LMG 5135]|nr:hypothetical protein l11_18970 [Neisseria weaveri LMG 5135]